MELPSDAPAKKIMELYHDICGMTETSMHFLTFHQMLSLHWTCLCVQDRERKIGFSMSCMAAKVRIRVDNFFSSAETSRGRVSLCSVVWPKLEVLERLVLVT